MERLGRSFAYRIISSHSCSGQAEVDPVITELSDDFDTLSIRDIQNHKTAYDLIRSILGSFAIGVAYNDGQSRTGVQVALVGIQRRSDIKVVIPNEWRSHQHGL